MEISKISHFLIIAMGHDELQILEAIGEVLEGLFPALADRLMDLGHIDFLGATDGTILVVVLLLDDLGLVVPSIEDDVTGEDTLDRHLLELLFLLGLLSDLSSSLDDLLSFLGLIVLHSLLTHFMYLRFYFDFVSITTDTFNNVIVTTKQRKYTKLILFTEYL